MADLLGVDRSTYSYYELGRINPDIKTIMKLSEVFGVHYTRILESETNYCFSDINGFSKKLSGEDKAKGTAYNLTPEEHNVLMAFKILPDDSKNEVMEFINQKFNSFRSEKRRKRFDEYFK